MKRRTPGLDLTGNPSLSLAEQLHHGRAAGDRDRRLAFGAGLAVLAGVALLAHVVPARRATRVDPLTALREE